MVLIDSASVSVCARVRMCMHIHIHINNNYSNLMGEGGVNYINIVLV